MSYPVQKWDRDDFTEESVSAVSYAMSEGKQAFGITLYAGLSSKYNMVSVEYHCCGTVWIR